MSKKKTHEEFLKELDVLFHGEVIPLEEYKSATEKIHFKGKTCNHHFEMMPNTLLSNRKGCPICAKINGNIKHKIKREKFEEQLKKVYPTLSIVGDFIDGRRPVDLVCSKCNNIWHLEHAQKILGIKDKENLQCPYCSGTKIIKGLNTLGDLRPDLLEYFIDQEEAFTLGEFSSKMVKLKCPNCGEEREMRCADLSTRGFFCHLCGNSVSLPNRIIRAVILLIKEQIDFYKFEYHNKKDLGKQSLDVYFEKDGNRFGIEMQGQQHFYCSNTSNAKKNLKKIQRNDQLKREKCKKALIKEIEIPCENTDVNYIRDSILNSELANILDLSNINWIEIYSQASKNIIKQVCEAYNNGYTLGEINKLYNVANCTIRKYLLKGTQLGWCIYDPKELHKRQMKNTAWKKVKVYTLENKFCKQFDSLKLAADYLTEEEGTDYFSSLIAQNCKQKINHYKNYIFKYAEEDKNNN